MGLAAVPAYVNEKNIEGLSFSCERAYFCGGKESVTVALSTVQLNFRCAYSYCALAILGLEIINQHSCAGRYTLKHFFLGYFVHSEFQ